MSITDFLLARIAEDEAAARAAVDNVAPDEWESELGSLNLWPQDIAHWNRHDPARVLAECAAKRAVAESMDVLTGGGKTYQQRMNHSTAEDAAYVIASDTLRTLAAVYADHPEYQDEWRVGA